MSKQQHRPAGSPPKRRSPRRAEAGGACRGGRGEEFADLLQRGAAALGLALTGDEELRLGAHFALLERWSARVNLVGLSDLRAVVERLYLESAVLARALAQRLPQRARCIDVGSGAGFPGLIIAALLPGVTMDLVESRRRKASFLSAASREMALEGTVTVHNAFLGGRRPRPAALSAGAYDLATSRAAMPIADWLALAATLVDAGGTVVALPGADAEAPAVAGLDGPTIERFTLPFSGHRRAFAIYVRQQ